MWRVSVVVVVDADVVLGEPQPEAGVGVGEHGHVHVRGLGVRGTRFGRERQAQGDRDAIAHESCSRRHPVRGQVVQGPAIVSRAPTTPGAQFGEQGPELVGADGQPGFAAIVHGARPEPAPSLGPLPAAENSSSSTGAWDRPRSPPLQARTRAAPVRRPERRRSRPRSAARAAERPRPAAYPPGPPGARAKASRQAFGRCPQAPWTPAHRLPSAPGATRGAPPCPSRQDTAVVAARRAAPQARGEV